MCPGPGTERKAKFSCPRDYLSNGERIRKWSDVLIRGGLQREQSPGQKPSEANSGEAPRTGGKGRPAWRGWQGGRQKGQPHRVRVPPPPSPPTPPPTTTPPPTAASLPLRTPCCAHRRATLDPALLTLRATCQEHPQGSKGLTSVDRPPAVPPGGCLPTVPGAAAPTAAEPSCLCFASTAAPSLTQGASGLEEREAPSSPQGLTQAPSSHTQTQHCSWLLVPQHTPLGVSTHRLGVSVHCLGVSTHHSGSAHTS